MHEGTKNKLIHIIKGEQEAESNENTTGSFDWLGFSFLFFFLSMK